MPDDLRANIKKRVREVVSNNDPENLDSFDVLCTEILNLNLKPKLLYPYPIDARPLPLKVYEFILQTILFVDHLRNQSNPEAKRHWGQVAKVREEIDKLKASFPQIRDLEPVFYEPKDLEKCRHDRVRYECYKLYADRSRIASLDSPPFNYTFPNTVKRIKRESADTMQYELDQLCSEPLPLPPIESVPTAGHPEDTWINQLVKDMVWILHQGHDMEFNDALDLVNEILLIVFNKSSNKDALRKRWHRIKKKTPLS